MPLDPDKFSDAMKKLGGGGVAAGGKQEFSIEVGLAAVFQPQELATAPGLGLQKEENTCKGYSSSLQR